MATLGERVAGRMAHLGLTQTELSRRTGMTQQHISQIIRGERQRIELGTAAKLALALSWTLDDLHPMYPIHTQMRDLDTRECDANAEIQR